MTKLPTRQLGKNGPQVTALGFGLMGLSIAYGSVDSDEDRFKVLDRAFELGEVFWDSSDLYGDNEDLLGKWFKKTGLRDQIFLASKFGFVFAADGSMSFRSDAQYVKQACEKSLKRLGVSKIDLYYMHRADEKTPIEETVKAMVELKNEGKIDYLGLSEVSSETLRRAHKVHPISTVQVEYNPFTLDIESPEIALLKTCRELGVAVTAYSPLGRGMMTGQYKSLDDFEQGDMRRYSPRYTTENFPKNLKLVDAFADLAKKKNCTTTQLTLAWLMAQGDDIIPIPGTKKIKYLEENVGAMHVSLTAAEVGEIRKVVDAAEVHGERYGPGIGGPLFADTPPLES